MGIGEKRRASASHIHASSEARNDKAMKNRIALLVFVDLDPVDGASFSTDESALDCVRGILENLIDRYNPMVAHAPDSMQPQIFRFPAKPDVLPPPTVADSTGSNALDREFLKTLQQNNTEGIIPA